MLIFSAPTIVPLSWILKFKGDIMNTKTLKIIAIVLAVTTVISAGAFFFTRSGDDGILNEIAKPEEYSYAESKYTLCGSLSVKGTGGEIFMPSDLDGIYYTATLDGKIDFYEYANGGFVPCTLEKKELSVKIKASYEEIPVRVSYIGRDGDIFGCGVFTSDNDSSVDVYSYAFVKLTRKPAGYGDGWLLLADFNKDDFYNPNKLWSEIYSINLENGKTSTYVSNNTRLIDKNGAFRSDWTLLTDDFINNLGSAKYFLSSRYYNSDDKGKRADVMVLSNAYRPQIVVSDILGLWFVNDSNGMHFLKKTDGGFSNIVSDGKNETELAKFEGDYFTDYLQDGKYLINKKTLTVTNLLTGATSTFKAGDIGGASGACVNPDGTRLVIYFNAEKNINNTEVQRIIYASTDDTDAESFAEPLLFAQSCGFVWLDSSSVMSVRALDGAGATFGSAVYTFNQQ